MWIHISESRISALRASWVSLWLLLKYKHYPQFAYNTLGVFLSRCIHTYICMYVRASHILHPKTTNPPFRHVHIVCRYQLGWNFSYAREQVLSTRLFCTSIFINSPVFFTWFLVMNFCRVYFWFSGLEFWFFILISS